MMESAYIVQTLGASWRVPSKLQMVLEWMDQGDLRGVLSATNSETFRWHDKATCMLAIAAGLVYLHSLSIIHRDLKSRNVLLDSTKGTKLTDFGASRELSSEMMTLGVGTCRWMAPEVLLDTHYTTAVDVYSFGVLLSELATHCLPYHTLRNDCGMPLAETAIISRVVQGSLRPVMDMPSCPPWVHALAMACTQWEPEARPMAVEIAHAIAVHMAAPILHHVL
ncbi:TKL protein kinase [Saprolegnia diclina VS20]|uniref:TKL protein kinase n=1 Tax=Saprolegnia diclina (strain VS20) TaxID=1156394 RepID=T0RY73_SAPDV|nr:TKL protein kinase [Saprolegnia diclina VS20]EQC35332.1 TKL protein kinase [Saprolegnia diclina VS20]|eukprot:XP_008611082.1 TKL protein kinase [Saprolegnia diclina VS20]